MSLFCTCTLLAAGLLAQVACPLPAAAQATPPHLPQLQAKYFTYASERLAHAVEERQPLRATLTLRIQPGVAAAAANRATEAPAAAEADSTEARTLRQGLVERRPAEAVADFLGRVLPVSFAEADKPISYAWYPSAYGPQLFFSAPGNRGPMVEYERNLFVLDPVGPTAYAVQVFNVQQADYTTLEALFFADANHDGQKDLLALTQCDLRENVKIDDQQMTGRFPHYQTTVIYYRGLDAAGRPRYEQQYREDLDELATAAEVRAALAAPPRKKAPRRNPGAKAAK